MSFSVQVRSIFLPLLRSVILNKYNQCILGLILKHNLSFVEHAPTVLFLDVAASVLILLRLLGDQGMPQIRLDTVFHALIISKIRYALCAWGRKECSMLFFVECLSTILSVNVSISMLLWLTWIGNFLKSCFPQPTVCILYFLL